MSSDDQRLRALLRSHVPGIIDAEITPGVLLMSGGLGLDSVGVLELLLDCEACFGVEFPLTLFDEALTLARLADHLARSRSGS